MNMKRTSFVGKLPPARLVAYFLASSLFVVSGIAEAGHYTCPNGGKLSGTKCVVESSFPASPRICTNYNKCSVVKNGGKYTWTSRWYGGCSGLLLSSDTWTNDGSPCIESTVRSQDGYACPSDYSTFGNMCVRSRSYNATYVASNCSFNGNNVLHGSSITAYASSIVPYGSSCASQTRTCNDGSLSGSYNASSCKVLPQAVSSVSATDGTVNGKIQVIWPPAEQARGYELRYRKKGLSSWKSAGLVSSGYMLSVSDLGLYEFQVRSVNDAGVTDWVPSSPETGYARVSAPVNLRATDGTVSKGINITWDAMGEGTAYTLQSRAKGTSDWKTIYTGKGTSHILSGMTDERVYEFQIQASNGLETSPFSAVETGYIRKAMDPKFVSQTGIPAKIGVGQSFTVNQVWRNDGSETWVANSVYGTGPFSTADNSVWSLGFQPFTTTAATGAQLTSTLSLKAPATAGTYNFQRTFFKDGVAYGEASKLEKIVVLDTPKCSGVTVDHKFTYTSSQSVTATIQGPVSVESASIKVWSEAGGQDDLETYAATEVSPGTWRATFPMAPHAQPGLVHVSVVVDNGVFEENECASMTFEHAVLPTPKLTLKPTVGTFSSGGKTGYVVPRHNGVFATGSVDIGPYDMLKVNIDILDANNQVIGTALRNQTVNEDLNFVSQFINGPAWNFTDAKIRVTYADQEAAAQGKFLDMPVGFVVGPYDMNPSMTFGSTMPLSSTVAVKGPSGADYKVADHGGFAARIERVSGDVFAPSMSLNEQGISLFGGLDYASVWNESLVGVIQALPPESINGQPATFALVKPIEFRTNATRIPLLPPASIIATDGTLEDEVGVTWPEVVAGSAIRYRVFRDGVDLTPNGPISGVKFVDSTAERGRTYTYGVRAVSGDETSGSMATDTGFIPLCRAPRLVGASLNADMSEISGLLERWECLEGTNTSAGIAPADLESINLEGDGIYRSFSVPIPASMSDGQYNLKLRVLSQGVELNADRTFDIPFDLNRSSITVNKINITYGNGLAKPGVEADSIGRFGVQMEGGTGIGFAEPIKQ